MHVNCLCYSGVELHLAVVENAVGCGVWLRGFVFSLPSALLLVPIHSACVFPVLCSLGNTCLCRCSDVHCNGDEMVDPMAVLCLVIDDAAWCHLCVVWRHVRLDVSILWLIPVGFSDFLVYFGF